MRKLRKPLLVMAMLVLVMLSIFSTKYVRGHPMVFKEGFWGHEHCIVITGLAFHNYAFDNGGRYPSHTNGYGNALLLMSDAVGGPGDLACLTGPGYSAKPFEDALAKGTSLTEEVCGRVYVQGLCETNDPGIALLFDKKANPGDHCHGLRRIWAKPVREVWTIRGGVHAVGLEEWPEFAHKQIELLVQAGISRKEAERLYAQVTN